MSRSLLYHNISTCFSDVTFSSIFVVVVVVVVFVVVVVSVVAVVAGVAVVVATGVDNAYHAS